MLNEGRDYSKNMSEISATLKSIEEDKKQVHPFVKDARIRGEKLLQDKSEIAQIQGNQKQKINEFINSSISNQVQLKSQLEAISKKMASTEIASTDINLNAISSIYWNTESQSILDFLNKN